MARHRQRQVCRVFDINTNFDFAFQISETTESSEPEKKGRRDPKAKEKRETCGKGKSLLSESRKINYQFSFQVRKPINGF